MEFENRKNHFFNVMKRGTELVEYIFEHCFFGFSNFPVRGVFDRNDLLQDDILILLNGEIYNCPADKSEFVYIRETYRQEGIDGFSKFLGKYLIVIYDIKKESLYFVRDYFGKIPLFFIEQDETLYFSSLSSSLLPFLHNHEKDDVSQFEMELLRYRSYNATTYKHIHQIPPNTVMVYRDGNITDRQLKTHIPCAYSDHSDKVEHLYDLLVESVTLTFRNIEKNTPIGVLVSGIDSYILFKILEQYYNGKILAFVFYGRKKPFEFDYNPDKTTLEATKLTFEDFYRNLNECIKLFKGIDRPAIKTYIFSRKIKEKYGNLKVVYCGEGADELFGGYVFNIRNIKYKIQYQNLLKENFEYNRSLLLKDYLNIERNAKSICDFFLRHQLVEVHLNPFNICFQHFLLELRSPFLTEKLFAYARGLSEEYFDDKKIIRELARRKFGFDSENYHKVSLPDSIDFC